MLTAKARAALESEKAQRAEKAQALQARAEVVTAALQQQRAMAAEQEAEIEAAVREAASAEAQNALEDRAASCFCQQLKGLTATFIRAVELESQWTYRDHRWMRIHSNQVVA
jgi:Skp family chaperone for outer membrane proteins